MWAFALSVLSCLSSLSWLLPQTFSDVCLLSVVMLLSLLVKRLSDNEWLISATWNFQEEVSKRLSFMADKLGYIERRLDAAQSTFSDVVRHVSVRIAEYNPEIGDWSVLQRWLRNERDQFELRRSLSDWRVVSACAQVSALNDLIYKRITEPGEETEQEVSRVVGTLRMLSKKASAGWASLRASDEQPFEPVAEEPAPSQLILSHLAEVLSHHRVGLRAVSDEYGVEYRVAAQGLSFSEVFTASFSQSS